AALDHADARVRANAVEALQQLESVEQAEDRLRDMAQADHNRPRANAIGALLEMQAGDALAALNRMLIDERPEQRVSALWLVKSMGVMEVARQIAELALRDADPDVRGRARDVAAQLLQKARE